LFGGNEEPGWRGIMQPILEAKLPFSLATVITGSVWALWHWPLWFIEGSIQSQFPFYQFTIYAIFLSFVMASIYRKSGSVFFCSLYHGESNVLLVYFVININWILCLGLLVIIFLSLIVSKKAHV
ncbi:CPBP family intramembrane metalloprotease, partial [Enterococcus faecalis]|nr:CPBP family intramembrane metalloprotease [Enterococcus faecalis]